MIEVSHWSVSDEYYKGDLSNLQIWVKGYVNFVSTKTIDLFDANGNFYKQEYIKSFKQEFANIRIDNAVSKKELIQIDYRFYIIPVSERHSLSEGRNRTYRMLTALGLKGFNTSFCQSEISIEKHHSFKRDKYKISRPLEVCFLGEYRYNTISFMEFNYKEYMQTYDDFVRKNPLWEKEALSIKRTNELIILDFYDIDVKTISSKNFNRLKYAIKALNIKINDKIKNK